MKKSLKLPTIVGIIVLILGLGAGIFLLQFNTIFRLGASPDQDPKNVRISNITDKSFTVSWTTDKETAGFVVYGEGTSPDQNAPDTDATAKSTHYVTVNGLKPGTEYNFKISSDGILKDNNGITWKAKTGPTLGSPKNTQIVSGNVVTANNQPVTNAIVYLNIGGQSLLSVKTSANGTWVVSLANARTSDLQNYSTLNDKSLIDVLVQSPTGSVSTAQVYLEAANPIPTMILGQTHDFKNEKPNNSSAAPKADVQLPQESTQSSQFDVGNTSTTPPGSSVTLNTIDPNEVVTTTKPQLAGDGPANTQITIVIHSTQEVTGTTTVNSKGEWNWTPPANLEAGTHTVTISWKDAQGILRTLTRTFVVEASSGPAIVATPSATPRSSPTATPRASVTPTATARVTSPATDSGTPVAGNITPTIVLLILAGLLISTAFYVGKKSFE